MGDMKWYVLRTAGSKEKKAKDYLEKEIERFGLQDQVAQVLVPVKREIVTKNGKRTVVERLLYPGYVLIQAQLCPELEYIIPVSYTHLTLPTIHPSCRSRWSPYH